MIQSQWHCARFELMGIGNKLVIGLGRLKRTSLVALLVSVIVSAPGVFGQDYTVNLKETDIQELIKFVAEATGTTIVVDPAVKGKVKVISAKPVSSSELYDLFLSILEVHGYTAVRSGGIVRVIPSKDARSAPVSVRGAGDFGNNDEYVTQVFNLENISAAKLIPVLRPLVPQQAHMAAYAPSNAIIISDIASNINRIRDIIERMDKSAIQKTDIVKLKYAVAEDIVGMLDKLNKSEAKQSGALEPDVLLVAAGASGETLLARLYGHLRRSHLLQRHFSLKAVRSPAPSMEPASQGESLA